MNRFLDGDEVSMVRTTKAVDAEIAARKAMLDHRIYLGDQPYNFDTLQDTADYMWLRGVLASQEYVELTGKQPPEYPDAQRRQMIAEIRSRMIPLCRTCESPLYYSGEYAAPGYGQAWRCGNGHEFCKLGSSFLSEPAIFTPEDVPEELIAKDRDRDEVR